MRNSLFIFSLFTIFSGFATATNSSCSPLSLPSEWKFEHVASTSLYTDTFAVFSKDGKQLASVDRQLDDILYEGSLYTVTLTSNGTMSAQSSFYIFSFAHIIGVYDCASKLLGSLQKVYTFSDTFTLAGANNGKLGWLIRTNLFSVTVELGDLKGKQPVYVQFSRDFFSSTWHARLTDPAAAAQADPLLTDGRMLVMYLANITDSPVQVLFSLCMHLLLIAILVGVIVFFYFLPPRYAIAPLAATDYKANYGSISSDPAPGGRAYV